MNANEKWNMLVLLGSHDRLDDAGFEVHVGGPESPTLSVARSLQ
jgi:hypothetical protein